MPEPDPSFANQAGDTVESCEADHLAAELSEAERARYEWQLWSPQIGAAGQQKLRAATVLISRL